MRQMALITGASGGIGLRLAEEFAAYCIDLILVARRQTERSPNAVGNDSNLGSTRSPWTLVPTRS